MTMTKTDGLENSFDKMADDLRSVLDAHRWRVGRLGV